MPETTRNQKTKNKLDRLNLIIKIMKINLKQLYISGTEVRMIAVKTMPDLTSERQLWKFRLGE